MSYQQIRFIGYTIDTMPQQDAAGNLIYLGLKSGTPPATSPADIGARCALMLRAMRTAAAKLASTSPPPSPTVLNVFMAPEFFFRGPMGAYGMDECQQVITQLQAIAATAEWSDWLFVFGSIIGVSAPVTGSAPSGPEPSLSKEAYNFTLIQLGGPGNTGGVGANVVMKELQAGCDFINTAAGPGSALIGNVNYLGAGAGPGPGREQQQVAYDGAGIFTQCGITWGVEICLDHYSGRLQRSPQIPGDPLIQFQLVPSGGMSIQPLQIMAMPGGYVFNCDGANAASATLKQVNGPGSATTVPPAGCAPVSPEPLDSDASPPAPITIDMLYAKGGGQVVLYAPVPVPAPAAVPGTVNDFTWDTGEYVITFRLVSDEDGILVAALCRIENDVLDFGGRAYFLPLLMQTTVAPFGHEVAFDISLRPGALGYTHGIYSRITTPQFDFDGYALLFDDAGAAHPKTATACW